MMSSDILETDPSEELEFLFVPSRSSQSILKLRNNSSYNAVFILQTTAPLSYVLSSNMGVLNPQEQTEIKITRQPSSKEPSQVNHKFQVLAGFMTEDINVIQKDIKMFRNNTFDNSIIQKQKLNVVLKQEQVSHRPHINTSQTQDQVKDTKFSNTKKV